MRTYHHLSLEEREKLFAWREKGLSLREIGKKLDRSHSSLVREWSRHTKYGKPYIPCTAHARSFRIAARQRYQAPLKCPLVWLYVREHLRMRWSPEQIAGRLPLDHPGYAIDDETIYRYIYGRKQKRNKFFRYLALHRKRRMHHHGRKVQSRGKIVEAVPIQARPAIVDKRKRLGDWESDNMEGKRSDTTTISVTVDRVARITRLQKLTNHTAEEKARILIQQFNTTDRDVKYTLTVDRGPENKKHHTITKETGVAVFFCTAYHSWEKGTVENTIGRIRRYIPKGKSIDSISEHYLATVETLLNNQPRKCLGYLTPNEMYEKLSKAS